LEQIEPEKTTAFSVPDELTEKDAAELYWRGLMERWLGWLSFEDRERRPPD
jgi:hypothetical protein